MVAVQCASASPPLIVVPSATTSRPGMSAPPGHVPPISHYGRPHGPDARVQRITRNLFERFRGGT